MLVFAWGLLAIATWNVGSAETQGPSLTRATNYVRFCLWKVGQPRTPALCW